MLYVYYPELEIIVLTLELLPCSIQGAGINL